MGFITINNNKCKIVSTNFYELDHSNSKFYFSINAGCIRILVPRQHMREFIKEVKLVDEFVLERKKNGNSYQFTLLLEDHSDNPYQIFCDEKSFDVVPDESFTKIPVPLLIYISKDGKLMRLNREMKVSVHFI